MLTALGYKQMSGFHACSGHPLPSGLRHHCMIAAIYRGKCHRQAGRSQFAVSLAVLGLVQPLFPPRRQVVQKQTSNQDRGAQQEGRRQLWCRPQIWPAACNDQAMISAERSWTKHVPSILRVRVRLAVCVCPERRDTDRHTRVACSLLSSVCLRHAALTIRELKDISDR